MPSPTATLIAHTVVVVATIGAAVTLALTGEITGYAALGVATASGVGGGAVTGLLAKGPKVGP